jgi:hypothetical protein
MAEPVRTSQRSQIAEEDMAEDGQQDRLEDLAEQAYEDIKTTVFPKSHHPVSQTSIEHRSWIQCSNLISINPQSNSIYMPL